MSKLQKSLIYFLVFYTVTSFTPLWNADYWWVRIWDFPRLQLSLLALLCIGTLVWTRKAALGKKNFYFLIPLAALILDGYRIMPYTPFYKIESVRYKPLTEDKEFSVLVANVFQMNNESESLLELIKEKSPDVILLLETNQEWARRLKALEKEYPVVFSRPLENTYGLILYSKLKINDGKIQYLVDKEIPSFQGTLITRDGLEVEIFGVHPKPPKPGDHSSERDAELVKVALKVEKINRPVLVMGDLNDVAWSHTSRLFRRISGLLDPRIGRGPFGTFPATIPLMRFPLDYVFHSKKLKLVEIQKLGDIGSDHFPLYSSFVYRPVKSDQFKGEKKQAEDVEEAEEIIEKTE